MKNLLNKKKVVNIYKVEKVLNIWTGEVEKLNDPIMDGMALSSLVVNGYEPIKVVKIASKKVRR